MSKLAPGQLYPTDLTDAEWAVLQPLLPTRRGPGRPRRVELRRVINGLRYLTRTGCQWRLVPLDFPYWGTVRYYFDKWTNDGTWVRLNDALRERERGRVGREPQPSAAILDSQSVKTTEEGGDRGYDAHKNVNGRKRQILVDTLGNLLRAVVHPADVQDTEGGQLLLRGLGTVFTRLAKLWTDQGYKASFVAWVETHLGWSVEVVQKLPDQTTFVVLPRRWVVERTLAWLNRHRRLSKDYEVRPEYSATYLYLASIYLLTRRLASAP